MIETAMTRTTWTDKNNFEDITVLICQNKTHDLIRLCLESLFTFYPKITTLVVNGSPNDQSGRWLKTQEAMRDNLTVWDRTGYDSHGVAMHEAIIGHVKSKYVLMLDSDVIFKRHGVIEIMYSSIKSDPYFAVGSLMNVTLSNHACGAPKDENDVLRYIHPSCGLVDVEMYKSFKSNFTDHGAPCVYPMIEAQEKGIPVLGVNVADYVLHLSGASWTDPRTIWPQDFGVFIRPLVTFISISSVLQVDNDYNVISPGDTIKTHVVIHGYEPVHVHNNLFSIRFHVTGYFVCVCDNPSTNLITILRNQIRNEVKNEYDIEGVKVYSREYFQQVISLR